jgi:Alpha/beta hydrolase domain
MLLRLAGAVYRPALIAATVAVVCAMSPSAQAPLPVAGQRGQGPAPGRQGQGPANLPQAPVVSPLATASPSAAGPGQMFPALMSLPAGDDMTHFGYEAKEYFVGGTANGQPYKTRVVVRKPSDDSRFSGIVLAESMHPSGNAWMFHFTHTYTMSSGHIGLEIVTSDPAQFVAFNSARYSDLRVGPGQANEIIAQVGALIRSSQATSPLAGLPVRKMILAGTSASAGVLVNYLPAHMIYRLADMKPIYDGFLPTSNGANIRQIDVPMIQVPTTTEAMRGTVPTRQDGDMPGDQFRVYEFPGMPHLDTRDVEAFRPNPCKYPISLFPMSAYMSVAHHHLVQWIDTGTVPPRADRMLVDRNTANDGSLIALDESGNPKGGIRTPYVDVPVAKYGVPNEAAVPPTPNTVPWVALRGEAGINQLCGLTGYQVPLADAQLKKLYGNKAAYLARVRQRVDELTRQGWSLPIYRDQILADAEKVSF